MAGEQKGQVNEYTCRVCNNTIHVLLLNTGTTPFGMLCPKCNGLDCFSNFYRITKKQVTITHAFLRPDKLPEDESMREFILGGAMTCKPFEEALKSYWVDDPITAKMLYDEMLSLMKDHYKIK